MLEQIGLKSLPLSSRVIQSQKSKFQQKSLLLKERKGSKVEKIKEHDETFKLPFN
jgi:hypothetical protein